MLVKVKFKGTTDSLFTHDQIYILVGVAQDSSAAGGVAISDGGALVPTGDLSNPAVWELVSVEAIGPLQVYP